MKKKLVLASTSKSRQQLLERLKISFEIIAPNVDEAPLKNEAPEKLVLRLATLKAKTVSKFFTDALIIGADQVGVCNSEIIGKPLTLVKAKQQLQKMSAQRICFYVGLCLLDTTTQKQQISVERYDVVFRELSDEIIIRYLQKEQPLQCAGSCQAEGLGITLIEECEGKDFTTLIGLPLIKLTQMLEIAGYNYL